MRKLRALLTHLNEVDTTKTHSVSNVSHTYMHILQLTNSSHIHLLENERIIVIMHTNIKQTMGV